jgi:hypothetical protein
LRNQEITVSESVLSIEMASMVGILK